MSDKKNTIEKIKKLDKKNECIRLKLRIKLIFSLTNRFTITEHAVKMLSITFQLLFVPFYSRRFPEKLSIIVIG